MTKLEKLRDKLAEKICPYDMYHSGGIEAIGFKKGFDRGAKEMAKIAKKREAKLVESTEEIVVWLKRMSLLAWEDPSYAPNFKKSFIKLEQALADHKRMMERE